MDERRAAAFADRMVGAVDAASLVLQCSIGDQLGLFDVMAGLDGATSEQIAQAAGVRERYVREWLAALTVAGVVEHDATARTYRLPPEHAASLTRAAGPDDLARLCQCIPMLAEAEQLVVQAFRSGGGVPYTAFSRFHAVMAEDSAAVNDASLVGTILPLVPGCPDRLTAGIEVADFGCGSGHAVNLMARAFPASRFVGYDFSPEAIGRARAEAAAWGLPNARFELQDVAVLDRVDAFDLITAFDTVHDQAQPGQVLATIARALRPDGVFLMVDVTGSSEVADNVGMPLATFLYTCSLLHCMPVSLGLDGVGLGTMWGRQTALRMLGEAGFADVEVREIETDPQNAYYVCTLG
ncbi:class I SAM-dependent methyltransferase [Geodermatophilus marinus]|nr:class I SAM-dependent methyltransferase [Geodermatophilus sp. LHW52908]